MNSIFIETLITGLANFARFCVISGDIARSLLKRKETPTADAEQPYDAVAKSTQTLPEVEPVLVQRIKRVENDIAVLKGLVVGAAAVSAVVVVAVLMMGRK